MKIMKCDARAFARCPYKKQCSDSPEHTSFYEGTECEYFNQQVIHAPLTNADRIRAMSDHDLAVFLEHAMYDSSEPDWMTVLSWLQQPAEEEP